MSSTFYPNFQPKGFWGSLINAILGRNTGKFKLSSYQYYPINQRLIMIDTSPGSLMKVAMAVPHLNTIISVGAELFSLMEIKHLDKNGKEKENSEVIKFLRQPNPLQSLEQFLYQFYVLNGVYNKTFQYQIKGLSFATLPKAVWLLPSGWMKINATGKIYRQTDINEIIESYEMLGETQEKFEVDKIIYMAEGIGENPLNPCSRIEALQIPLSNIMASLKSRNKIIAELGMIGFLAPQQMKDSDGQIPLSDTEHERIRQEYQNTYHLDSTSGHVAFMKTPMEWKPMTFDVGQLKLIEGTEDDFGQLCNSFRHDRDIYSSTKGATFENKSAGMKSTVQNGLQPLADKLMKQWTKHFIGNESGESLCASYAHLPCMQEDERLAAQGSLYKAQALEIGLHNGVINDETFAQEMEWEKTGDGVIIQRSNISNPGNEPAKLRLINE